mmetsp:Transcript_174895/g.560789  ORF Transcript_174895/g.560789 Transcript_174895/m.560789 type:complete len:295 (-) Transcript_174895:34-918(-)
MSDARALVRQADAKLNGGFLNCLGGTRRFEEAIELYQQAANQFKLTKEWQEAANCYTQCSYCAQKTGDQAGEADNLQEAGNILKRISTSQAVELYEQAVVLLAASGRFPQAGKLLMAIAELYEQERLDDKAPKGYWKRAAELYELDDHGKSNLTKCNLKVAEYSARDGELQEAIKLFEVEGEKALKTTMLQYGAKEHFLRAGLVHLLVGDAVTVNLAVERYDTLDPRFGGSREGELLAGLAQTYEAGDAEAFVERLSLYDTVTKLDPWKTEILLKVKHSLQPPDGNSLESVDLS